MRIQDRGGSPSLFMRFRSYIFLDLCSAFLKDTGRPWSAISSSRAALRLASMKSASVIRSFFCFFFRDFTGSLDLLADQFQETLVVHLLVCDILAIVKQRIGRDWRRSVPGLLLAL